MGHQSQIAPGGLAKSPCCVLEAQTWDLHEFKEIPSQAGQTH